MSRETKIIALTGKGGVGKTSISAALVKLLVEEFPEKKILAIDADPAIGLATALGIEPELTLDDIRNEIVANVEDGNTKEAMELLSESRYKIAEAIVEKRRFCVSCNRTSGVSRMLLPHQFIFKRSDHDDLRAV